VRPTAAAASNSPVERTEARAARSGRSPVRSPHRRRGLSGTSKGRTRAVKVQLTSAILAFVLLAAPLVAEAQQGRKVGRIGLLATSFSSEHPQRELSDAFQRGLRELGYLEGQNIVIEDDPRRVGPSGFRTSSRSWRASRWI
jgi:hypothetical protein